MIGSRHLKEGEKLDSSFCSLGLYLPTKLKVAHDKKIFLRHHLFVMTLLNFSCFPHVDPYIHTYNRITKCWRSISITNSGMGPIESKSRPSIYYTSLVLLPVDFMSDRSRAFKPWPFNSGDLLCLGDCSPLASGSALGY